MQLPDIHWTARPLPAAEVLSKNVLCRFHCRWGLRGTCFRKNRRLLPDFHLTENMARTRIATMQERGRSEVSCIHITIMLRAAPQRTSTLVHGIAWQQELACTESFRGTP